GRRRAPGRAGRGPGGRRPVAGARARPPGRGRPDGTPPRSARPPRPHPAPDTRRPGPARTRRRRAGHPAPPAVQGCQRRRPGSLSARIRHPQDHAGQAVGLGHRGGPPAMKLPDANELLFSAKCYLGAITALYLSYSIGLPRPFWAMTTAYVVSQPWAGAVRSKAVFRLGGTFF